MRSVMPSSSSPCCMARLLSASLLVALFIPLLLLAASARALRAGPTAVRDSLVASVSGDPKAGGDQYAVPEGMLIGAGVSAIQTEGAWNVDGKGESAIDHVFHTDEAQQLGLNGTLIEVAADSYHRFREDVAMAAKLKLKLYRFSFSWARLLPTADATAPNPKGVAYYHAFIDEMIKYNITPQATLFHFDDPYAIFVRHNISGWDDYAMVAKFKEYARFVFNEYGSKVKMWTTLNEPNMYCAYFGKMFSAIEGSGKPKDKYECMRNVLLAHAEAYRAYYEDGNDGQVGFSAVVEHASPASASPEDVFVAEAYNHADFGLVFAPLVFGDYPQVAKQLLGDKLKEFSPEEKALLKGASDFFGLNVYYSMIATYGDPSAGNPLEYLPNGFVRPASNNSAMDFSAIDPVAMRSALLWAWYEYGLPILVTENGFGEKPGQPLGIHDQARAAYHSAYLRTLVKTARDFNIKVIGYAAWSLIDSFEWTAGFNRPFGLVHVDYEGGTLDRSLKDSASFWIELADTGVVPLVEPVPSSATRETSSSSPGLLLLSASLLSALTMLRTML